MTDITHEVRPQLDAPVRGRAKGTGRRGLALLSGVLVLGLTPAAAQADSAAAEAGIGAGAALCSLVYAPVKIVYALGGFIIGGFAWGLSAGDADVANAVITPATRGDYVVTPSHLRGEEPLEFIGREPTPVYTPAQVSQPAPY